MDVVRNCICCNKQHVIRVNQEGYKAWRRGELIQNALPNVSPEDREMLISGICPVCWDKMFEE